LAASLKNEVAMGYKLIEHETNPERNYGIVINPEKSAMIKLNEEDCIILLAEE